MRNDDILKQFSIKNYCWAVVLLWTGFLFASLSRYPNQFTALIFDQWKIMLPFTSVMVIAFGLCRKFQWRVVRVSLIVVCVLFSIAVLNFSVWLPIAIHNNTSVSLRAVMTDLSNNRIRSVSVSPGRTKLIELLKSQDDTFGNIQWYLLVYDKTGSVYLQKIIKGNNIGRRHIIQIYPNTSENGSNLSEEEVIAE